MPVPVALGVLRGEICVPPRALAGLTDEQQEGMLAHELAHLARRDPLLARRSGRCSTCVFFFQPLNWVARRRLREISEMLSDEWAVARTGRPLSLAGCLAEVAGWSVVRRRCRCPAWRTGRRSLGRRIRRLLDGTRSPEKPARRVWLAAAMVVVVTVVATAAPAVSAVSAAGQEASVQPARPAVAAVQALPKVVMAAKPEDHRAAPVERIAAVQVLPQEEQKKPKKMEPKRSDHKVAPETARPAEEPREDKPDQKESGKKPPKMVLKVDSWGNLRLVPEDGC